MGAAVVLATANAGVSWSEQWGGALIPTQLVSTDATHAWLLGRHQSDCAGRACRSVLVGTADGGTRWSVLTRFAGVVSGVAFAPGGLGLAAAHAVSCRDRVSGPPRRCPGQVLISHDGGRRWRVVLRVTQPVVAVAAARDALWALVARIGGLACPQRMDMGARSRSASWCCAAAMPAAPGRRVEGFKPDRSRECRCGRSC
jgi:hypothetical protein